MKSVRNQIVTAVIVAASATGASALSLSSDSVSWGSSGSPLSANASWANQGLSLSWNISPILGGFRYEYTLSVPAVEEQTYNPAGKPTGTKTVVKNPSHMLIEVSPLLSQDDVWNFSGPAKLDGPELFGAEGKSNPGIPSELWALKFDSITAGSTFQTSWTFAFDSHFAPGWGDFYGKSGMDAGKNVWAQNTGFSNEDANDGFHIAVPAVPFVATLPAAVELPSLPLETIEPAETNKDSLPTTATAAATPESGETLVLLGFSAAGLAIAYRRKK